MWYLPPREEWYLTAARLSVSFDDRSTGSGTGFFVHHNDNYYIVTARHVVDPRYRPPREFRNTICINIILDFLIVLNPGTGRAGVGSARTSIENPAFRFSEDDCDLAIFRVPSEHLPVVEVGAVHRPFSFPVEFIANRNDLSVRYAGEPALFIGYPRVSPTVELGTGDAIISHTFPLARQGILALPTSLSTGVDGFRGMNYGLLDSFALNGFSGSPLISLQRGFAGGNPQAEAEFRPSRLLGVICGHMRSLEDRAEGSHSGLSYFVRADSLGAMFALAV